MGTRAPLFPTDASAHAANIAIFREAAPREEETRFAIISLAESIPAARYETHARVTVSW